MVLVNKKLLECKYTTGDEGMFKNGFAVGGFSPKVLFVTKAFGTGRAETHTHNFMELTYVVAGKGKYILDDREYSVEEGDLILVNPGVKHISEPSNLENPLVMIAICFHEFQIEGMPENHIALSDKGAVVHTKEAVSDIRSLCNSIWWERNQKNLGYKYMIKGMVGQLIILLLRHEYNEQYWESNPCRRKGRGNNAQLVTYVKQYIEKNFESKLTLDTLAEEVSLSPVYFSKIFKDSTGMSPVQCVIMTRLGVANVMLRENPYLSVREIANRVGYDDVCHFSKMFKKKYGIPPSACRK